MKKNMTEQEFLDHSLKRNRPNIVFPIISTIFSIALLVGLIVLFVKGDIELTFFLFGLLILILMPICSWYTNYFGRIKNQQKIYSYQDETEILVNFAKRLKGYKTLDITEENKIDYVINFNDSLVLEKVDFNNEKCLLNNGYLSGTLLTIGVSFAGLLINAKSKKVTTVSGLLPKSIWYRKKLSVPVALKGEVIVNHKDISNFTIMKCLKDEPSFYDSKSGWLCIGNKKLVKNTTNVQIMENVILVFEDNELKSLWINLGVNL